MNPPTASFCHKCGAPIGFQAFIGPGERLKSNWWVMRRVTSQPVRPIVLWGYLLCFVLALFFFGAILVSETSILKRLWILLFIVLDAIFVWKVIGQFRADKPRKGQ